MTTYVHQCLIVQADMAPLARQLTAAVAGPAGGGMFLTPLSPTGAEPATHYISSGMIDQNMADLLQHTDDLFSLLDGKVEIEYEELEWLLLKSDISDDQPFDALARLGLQVINTPE